MTNQPINPSKKVLSLKEIRKLQEKRTRDQMGLAYIEGNRIVTQALKSNVVIQQCVYAPDLLNSPRSQQTIVDLEQRQIPVTAVSAAAAWPCRLCRPPPETSGKQPGCLGAGPAPGTSPTQWYGG